jgi:alkanesulfonate monooxygenase SsuD/methylene tetrahydromethanopterin reductase-like flavin-dependent oxidoreductase (luciferase family)
VAFPMSQPNTRRSLPARFGIVAPAIPVLIVHCETAEALGFEAAWLFDSHMVYSDVYVIMALYAHQTRRMTFGTGTAVAPPRRFRTTSGVSSGMTGSTLCQRHTLMSPC